MEFTLDNGIKTIDVNNQDGVLITTLRINTADAKVAERFAVSIDNLEGVSSDYEKESLALEEKYKGEPEDDISTAQVLDHSRVNVSYINRLIEEINAVFGENTVQNVYREAYELNPDFLPDELAIVELVNKLVPLMNELFGARYKEIRKSYTPGRRGKHTKTKQELIDEYKEARAND